VKLFRPHRIIPNTLDPGLANLDWIAIDNMFRECLSSHGESIVESIRGDITKKISDDDTSLRLDSWVELAGEKGDAALKDLEGGDEAIGLAARWTTPNEWGLKKLQRMQGYLPESTRFFLEKVISQAEARVQALAEERVKEENQASQARSERSEETDEDRCDDRGNTAHRIFAGSSFIRAERSPSAPVQEARFYTPVSSPRGIKNYRQLHVASPTPPSSTFNQEYADWFAPITPTKERPNPLPKTPEFRSSKPPPSPSTVARREKRKAEREERRRTALKLGRARPDLVSREFTEKFLTPTEEEQP